MYIFVHFYIVLFIHFYIIINNVEDYENLADAINYDYYDYDNRKAKDKDKDDYEIGL